MVWIQAVGRIGGLGVVVTLVLLAMSTPVAAAPKPITGKLSKPGYTVIALAANDQASVVRANRGRFRLAPPRVRVTLHLRAPNGRYAGPIVIGRKRKGRRAILGVKAGAQLGRVRVKSGYAKLSKPLRKKWVNASLTARARKGVPIGARNFGRVRSRPTRPATPGDPDLDGIPDLLDVDDDGDLILDNLDRSSGTRSARAAQDGVIERFGLHTRLQLDPQRTANANAAGLTPEQIDTALLSQGNLLLDVMPGDSLPNSPELDCGGAIQQPPRPVGLVYCRPHTSGGIGKVFGAPFPDNFDPDGDGLGTLSADGPPPPLGGRAGMTLEHHATTAQIGTGDVLIQRVTRGGVETSFLTALQYVLATVPALGSYNDGVGPERTVQYPNPTVPLPVTARPNGEVLVTLTFWRPQRRAVPEWGEPGDWIDIGGLDYEVQVGYTGRRCEQSAFTAPGPNLTPIPIRPTRPGASGFSDLAASQPANTANTFTYSLNLTQCLASNGFSFNPGEERGFNFLAVNPDGVDNAQQFMPFVRQ